MDSPDADAGLVMVVGSISADVTVFAPRRPAPGETVLGDDATLVLGGKGANQAVASALAGAETLMVGCVGDDLFRDLTLGALASYGVDTGNVRVVRGSPTGLAHIRVDAEGENDIVVVPLANAHLGVEDVNGALLASSGSARVLLTQLETPMEVTAHVVRTARAAGLLVVLDPAPAASVEDDLWASVDVVTPNETEARLITGVAVRDVESAGEAGQWFVDRGVTHALVTLGGQGLVLVDAGGRHHVAAPSVEVVDTTAAGDAFAGYLGAELARGRTVTEAVPRAMAAGALAVTRRGASASLPTAAEVSAFLAGSGD